MGITAKAVIAGIETTNGARVKTILSAAVGAKSSLNISCMPSASDCSSPNGPFMLGPWRCCMKATTRRSYQIVNSVSSSSSTNANSALSATTHHGSLKKTSRFIVDSNDAHARRADRHKITSSSGEMLRNPQAWSTGWQPDDAVDHPRFEHRRQCDRAAIVTDHCHAADPGSSGCAGAHPRLGGTCCGLQV